MLLSLKSDLDRLVTRTSKSRAIRYINDLYPSSMHILEVRLVYMTGYKYELMQQSGIFNLISYLISSIALFPGPSRKEIHFYTRLVNYHSSVYIIA